MRISLLLNELQLQCRSPLSRLTFQLPSGKALRAFVPLSEGQGVLR